MGDGADVVRSQGQLDAALARTLRDGLDEHRRHALETGVGGPFVGPDRHGPAHLLGMDQFVVPVGALDQPHTHLTAAAAGPVNQPRGVFRPAAQIGLHGHTGGKIDGFATALEKGDRQILDGRLLHVEVDRHPLRGRFTEDRVQGGRKGSQGAFEVDRIGPRAQGAGLDRDARPRHGAEVVAFQARLGRPMADFRRQDLQQIEVATLVGLGLGLADAGLTEQVDAEGHALCPQVAQDGQGSRGVGPGDEIARHGRDALGDRLAPRVPWPAPPLSSPDPARSARLRPVG